MISREEAREALTGPVSSLSTPFTFDEDVGYAGLRKQVDGNLAGGSSSALLTYGDSLFTLLSDDEISAVIRVVADQPGKRGLTGGFDAGSARTYRNRWPLASEAFLQPESPGTGGPQGLLPTPRLTIVSRS